MDQKKAAYIQVSMRRSGDAYAMHTETRSIRRLTPKTFRSKKERVRARRLAMQTRGR